MGVGKTTVGKRIPDRVTGTAFIDGDWCLDLKSVTLLCDEEELTARWKGDTACEWCTDEWLACSLRSLPYFAGQENCVDTTGLTADQVADLLMQ